MDLQCKIATFLKVHVLKQIALLSTFLNVIKQMKLNIQFFSYLNVHFNLINSSQTIITQFFNTFSLNRTTN